MKKVFPLVYFVAFLYTLYSIVIGFNLETELLKGVNGDNNIKVIKSLILLLVFMTSLNLLLLYVKMEYIEDDNTRQSFPNSLTNISEYAIRLLLVSLITLKILQFKLLDTLLLYLFCIMFLFIIWLFIINNFKFFNNIVLTAVILLAITICSVLLGLNEDNAIFQIILITLDILCLMVFFYFNIKECKIKLNELKEYVTVWK